MNEIKTPDKLKTSEGQAEDEEDALLVAIKQNIDK